VQFLEKTKEGKEKGTKFKATVLGSVTFTKCFAPSSPNSSAAHQAKRILLVFSFIKKCYKEKGRKANNTILSFEYWMASSKLVVEPEPLSLMPGPAGTESKWDPTTTIGFTFQGK
jgi:hypothetical protein